MSGTIPFLPLFVSLSATEEESNSEADVLESILLESSTVELLSVADEVSSIFYGESVSDGSVVTDGVLVVSEGFS